MGKIENKIAGHRGYYFMIFLAILYNFWLMGKENQTGNEEVPQMENNLEYSSVGPISNLNDWLIQFPPKNNS
ncbi:hypothetical protein [Pararhodonellum marinum]|uniref:hypothetical protein n=1 Tax=Pararhodonellum marinum TaxID=2755358 RepID=UPI00188FF80C|nr:hypothetical protein [Pararhodonellum marinum]